MGTLGLGLEDYVHKPLSIGNIRLVRLLPGPPSLDQIVCRLDVISLYTVQEQERAPLPEYTEGDSSPTSFYALSYVWGPEEPVQSIIIKDDTNSYRLKVRPNLHSALRRLRNQHNTRTFWIDRISIDQTNLAERASQVALMGPIYSRAYAVLIWLGDTTSSTDPFKEVVSMGREAEAWYEKIVAQGSNPRSHLDEIMTVPDEYSEECKNIQLLLDNEWFYRSWTAQEIALAGKALVMQGPYIVSYAFFDYLGGTLESYFTVRDAKKSWIMAKADVLRQSYAIRSYLHGFPVRGSNSRAHVSMAQLVLEYRGRNATDPRDKIWAFLGIADDAEVLKQHVDYVSSWQAIYTKFGHWMCQNDHILNIFKLVHVKDQTESKSAAGLPSWIPDFRREVPLLDCMYLRYDPLSNGNIKNLPESAKVYAASGSSQFTHRNELEHTFLIVEGFMIGKISTLSCVSGNLVDGIAIGTAVDRNGDWLRLVRETLSPEDHYVYTNESIEKAFMRLRIGDLLPGENGCRRQRVQFPEDLPEPEINVVGRDAGRKWRLITDNPISNSILNATTNRRLFITNTKYMGLGHQSAIVGDEVWILMGADMPVILRPTSQTQSDNRQKPRSCFHFQGESYVHGAMDGEILMRERQKREPEWVACKTWLDSLGPAPWPFQPETIALC